MRNVILASQSPRRRELLTAMGVPFQAVPSNFEEHLDDARTPAEVAAELGLGKARAVAEQYPEAIVIGSDTVVCIDGKQLAKPENLDEARDMLHLLRGRANTVVTSVAVICNAENTVLVGTDATEVVFTDADDASIEAYVQTGDPLDKAGGYGIQSGAALLIDHITGEYDTVVGLPTRLVAEYLQHFGIPAQPVELPSPVPQRQRTVRE